MGQAPGMDCFTNQLIKKGSEVPYLLKIFQVSLRLGKVPTGWKEAVVIPVFKGGDKRRVDNYRPVSLTSAVCKIMERVVDRKLKALLDEGQGADSRISKSQHGFREGFSCKTLGFAEDTSRSLDKNGRVDALY